MKESNIDLSEIPFDWEVIPCGYFFKEKSIKNNIGEINLSVYRDYGVIPRDSRDDNHNRVSEDISNYKLVDKGDFVLNKMKCWMGSLGVSNYRGIVSPSYTVLEPKREIHNQYFHYLLRSEQYRQIYESLSYGVRVGQWELRFHDFKLIPALYPKIKEQEFISKYLDNKTQKINSLIEKIEKKIELLNEQKTAMINQYVTRGLDLNVEMKDSGVKGIGDIPKNWSLKKISHIVNFIGSGTTPKSNLKEYYENGEVNWLITGDLNDHEIYETSKKITLKAQEDTSLKTYPSNSLVIAMYGATIGKLGILKVKSTVNQACCVLNFDINQDIDFWFNSFLGNREYLISLGYGGGQPNISQETIKGLRLPSPPDKSEQILISKFLKKQSKKINNLIKKHIKKKDLLCEYRQSLISAVVTGKIRITEDMI